MFLFHGAYLKGRFVPRSSMQVAIKVHLHWILQRLTWLKHFNKNENQILTRKASMATKAVSRRGLAKMSRCRTLYRAVVTSGRFAFACGRCGWSTVSGHLKGFRRSHIIRNTLKYKASGSWLLRSSTNSDKNVWPSAIGFTRRVLGHISVVNFMEITAISTLCWTRIQE